LFFVLCSLSLFLLWSFVVAFCCRFMLLALVLVLVLVLVLSLYLYLYLYC
jgi:hypothetical protein